MNVSVDASLLQESAELNLTAWFASRLDSLREAVLPPDVMVAAEDRIVDAVASCISGSRLPAGEMGRRYVLQLGGTPESLVIGSDQLVPAVNAALSNGMMAHADETDDVDLVTKAHPGSCVIPAALAVAEREGASGGCFIRSVVAGYDTYCRMLQALDSDALNASGRSRQGIGSTFATSATAGLLVGLDQAELQGLFSVAAQQASGTTSWARDVDHIEKAFDLAGMGARNGVAAATMVKAGMTGVPAVFEGEPSVLRALSPAAVPQNAVLSSDTWLVRSAIKEFPVGYPIQAVLNSLRDITSAHPIDAGSVERIHLELPPDGASIVDSRAMPSINVQHVAALWVVDGEISFDSVHSEERMSDPQVVDLVARTELTGSSEQWSRDATRQAKVRIVMASGERYEAHTRFAKGTGPNPMTSSEIDEKALGLIAPVTGEKRATDLVQAFRSLTDVADMREIRPVLAF